MRLRSFTAPTIAQAMQLVRDELGDEAIIVSTHAATRTSPARVTAAIENTLPELEPTDSAAATAAMPAATPEDRSRRAIRDAFDFHGVPAVLAQRLGALAGDALAAGVKDDALLSLAAALDGRFRFAPLSEPRPHARPLVLVGPAGAGKTTTIAKLAARAALAGKRIGVISADTQRAGGVDQLAAFTRVLGLDIQVAEDPGALADAIRAAAGLDGVVVDTAGANPYDDGELARLKTFVDAAAAAPRDGTAIPPAAADTLLVLPAGGDPLEAAEAAVAFAEIGARRLLATRLDAARRFGSLLTAAEAGRLAFSEVGLTPHIAHGLKPLNPVALARLLLGEMLALGDAQESFKAVS